jgi:putative membrane protein
MSGAVLGPESEVRSVTHRIPVLAACAVFAGAALATTATGAGTSLSALDRHYLKSSAEGDAFEIRGGKLALEKSADREVRKLARTLVKDHSKSLRETEALARSLGVRVDAKPSPSQAWELAIVETKSGRAFDSWYASLEVQDHMQDITEAIEERDRGSNSRVRASARKELPDLRKHLKLAKRALR